MSLRTVVLVDRDRDSLVIYSSILEHHGYRVLQTPCPEQGLSLARAGPVDLVVTDLFLPPVDGEPLAARLKGTAETAHLPVVGLSALPQSLDPITDACDSYLPKPCVPSRLLAEVERLLAAQVPVLGR